MINNYIPYKIMNMFTYPFPHLNWSMSVNEAPGNTGRQITMTPTTYAK